MRTTDIDQFVVVGQLVHLVGDLAAHRLSECLPLGGAGRSRRVLEIVELAVGCLVQAAGDALTAAGWDDRDVHDDLAVDVHVQLTDPLPVLDREPAVQDFGLGVVGALAVLDLDHFVPLGDVNHYT